MKSHVCTKHNLSFSMKDGCPRCPDDTYWIRKNASRITYKVSNLVLAFDDYAEIENPYRSTMLLIDDITFVFNTIA